MKFYNREKELELLKKTYARTGSDLIVISGRRRVGKSRLIVEFAKDKKNISLLIVPKEERQVAKDLEEEIRSKMGYSPAFNSLKDAYSNISLNKMLSLYASTSSPMYLS